MTNPTDTEKLAQALRELIPYAAECAACPGYRIKNAREALAAHESRAQPASVPAGWIIEELDDGFIHIESKQHAVNLGYAPQGDRVASELLRQLACALLEAQPASVAGDGLALIASEYDRQRRVEGFTPEHDDEHTDGELAMAASCYAKPGNRITFRNDGTPAAWPWDASWWKPRPDDRIRELMKAGALIVAEIDRLLRAAAPQPPANDVYCCRHGIPITKVCEKCYPED